MSIISFLKEKRVKKVLRAIHYICLCLCFLAVACLYWSLANPSSSLSGEGDLLLLAIIFIVPLPILGIWSLFLIPQPYKGLPWLGLILLNWEAPIFRDSKWIPINPIWNWIGLAVALIFSGLALFCLFRINKIEDGPNPKQ